MVGTVGHTVPEGSLRADVPSNVVTSSGGTGFADDLWLIGGKSPVGRHVSHVGSAPTAMVVPSPMLASYWTPYCPYREDQLLVGMCWGVGLGEAVSLEWAWICRGWTDWAL